MRLRAPMRAFLPMLLATGIAAAAPWHGEAPAAFPPKPMPPIAIAWVVAAPPVLGVPVEIRFNVTAAFALDDVTVRIATSPGLVLNTGPDLRAARVSERESLEFVVSVTPVETEVLDVHVDVTGLAAGHPQGRHLSIPLRLGPRERRQVELKPDPATGGQVHSLPAAPRPSGRLR